MSSRSRTSTSSRLLAVIATLVLCAGVASAGRKRIVVLDFEGPKAAKIHGDLVKLLKKQHTVVPASKWNSTADELEASNASDKNIKKVAKKLKVDGVVTGRVEKRRDEYIVHIKLHAGKSGEVAGNPIDTKSETGRLDSKAQREIKDELLTAIDELEANHGGGGDDEEEADAKPAKKGKAAAKGGDDEEADAKPAKKGKAAKGGDDEVAADDSGSSSSSSKKKGFSKKFDKGGDKAGAGDDEADAKPAKKGKGGDDEADSKPAKKGKGGDDEATAALSTKHDDEESPLAKSKKRPAKADDEEDDSGSKKKKKVAKKGDDEGEEATAESDEAAPESVSKWSVAERAIDFSGGLSFTARRLTFDAKSYLTGSQIPPNYTQSVPVAGALVDVTVFPLAFKHDRHDLLTGIGLELLYDRVLKINSQKLYGMTGMQQVANLETAESRFALGAVFRYALGKGEKAPVVGGKLSYEKQSFTVAQTTPDGKATDIPNVEYSIIEPSVFFRYPVMPKLVVGLDAGFLLVSSAGTTAGTVAGTGDIGASTVYGQATASGYELAGGAEYALTSRVFARAVFRLESIGFTFKNDMTTLANNRDSDATTQDVAGASDVYFGGFVALGFLY